MYLIYDKKIKRYVGITDTNKPFNGYEIREWSQDGQDDFESYKLEKAVDDTEIIVEEEVVEAVIEQAKSEPIDYLEDTESMV